MSEAYYFILDQFRNFFDIADTWVIFPGLTLLGLFASVILLNAVITIFIPTITPGSARGIFTKPTKERYRKGK